MIVGYRSAQRDHMFVLNGKSKQKLKKLICDWQFVATISFLGFVVSFILLDVFPFRQILGFLAYTFLPGFLIVVALRLNHMGILKKLLLSVGFGVAFLMFTVLLIDTTYYALGFKTPLSTQSLTISLSPIVFVLFLVAYRRSKGNVFPVNLLRGFLESRKITQFLFPLLLPILAVAGTEIMNTTGNNVLLLLLAFLIISYSLALFIRKPAYGFVYPVSLWMISIASILMLSLRSSHIIGYDVFWELQISQLTMDSLHWTPSSFFGAVGANLTVGLLPVAYSSLLGIDLEYVYKAVFAFIFSVTPLVVFAITRGFVRDRFAFAASLFFVFQSTFAFVSQSNPRTAVAILFFALAVLVLFDPHIRKSKKSLMAILLISSVIISHYTTTFIFLTILFGVYLGSLLPFRWMPNSERILRKSIPVLGFVLMFFWYGQMTGPAFTKGVKSFQIVFENFGRFLLLESRHEGTVHVMGVGANSIPDVLYSIDHYVMAVIIAIGVLGLARLVISKRGRLKDFVRSPNSNLLLMMIICSAFVAAMILLPFASSSYTMDRLWTQMLVLLSGAFVIGCILVARNRRTLAVSLVGALLIIQFVTGTYLVYQAFGIHKSMVFNPDGQEYAQFYVHDEEIAGAQWLGHTMDRELQVFTDFEGTRRLTFGNVPGGWSSKTFFRSNRSADGNYVYLGYYNVVNGEISTGTEFISISHFHSLFQVSSKIYDNGGCVIHK